MKKLFVVPLALSIMAGVAVAQSDMGMGKVVKKDSSASAPLKTAKYTVKSEGDKVTLVSDEQKILGCRQSRGAQGT